jgi:putative Holliday junction resolvase
MHSEALLGIDLGRKRTGVAISHGFMAEGLKTLDYSSRDKFIDELKRIIDEQKIEKIIIGVPFLSDKKSEQTDWAIAQVKFITQALDIPVETVDEAYSSVEADKYMADRDSESARIILEQYLAHL